MGDPAEVQSPPNHVRSMGWNAQDCARRILLHHEKLQMKNWNILHEVNHECKTTSYTDMKLFLRIKKLEWLQQKILQGIKNIITETSMTILPRMFLQEQESLPTFNKSWYFLSSETSTNWWIKIKNKFKFESWNYLKASQLKRFKNLSTKMKKNYLG